MDYLNYGKTVSSMKVSILDQNFPAIVIDNFYNKVEEDLIWNELNFLIDGNEGWLELKYMPEYPKKDYTEIKVPHFTKEQKLWHDARYKNKGRTMVLIQVDSDYFIFKKERINLLGSLTKKSMFKFANKSWKNRIDFKELRKELCA